MPEATASTQPAKPGRQMPTYEALALDIRAQGIHTVFGLMSDDTALFVATLDSLGVRFVGARHENTALCMAEGYAAATGRLGVAIIGRGPATANGLHGAVYAQRSGSPVLLICGCTALTPVAANALGPDTKAFNAAGVLQAAGIPTLLATAAATARHTLAQAFQATRHGGCLALLLPMDVQFASQWVDDTAAEAVPQLAAVPEATNTAQAARAAGPYSQALPPMPAPARPAPTPRAAAIQAAAALLASARRPVFIAGLGACRPGVPEAIAALADQVGAVLATSLKAKDLFRGHPYNVGIVGSFSHGAARRLIDQADCVVVFGAGLNQRTTSYGTALPQGVPLVQVDADRSHIGRWHAVDVAVVGDAGQAATQLAAALGPRPAADKPFHSARNRRLLAELDLSASFTPQHTPRTLDPRALAIAIDRLLPADRTAVYDAGNFLQVLPFIGGLGPAHLKNSHDFSSIGMGFGTALGFATGRPDRCTALFIGDGSLLMTLGELETAVREDIPLVIVLMNDCAYGAELHYLQQRDMPVARSVFPDIDFAPIAEGFGFQAHTVRTLADLDTLAPVLRAPDGPILLDCKINAAVVAPFLLESVAHERRPR